MEDGDGDIAAAMGFSSFGGTKKRKYDQSNSPKPSTAASSSGANSTQLGVRTKRTAKDETDADSVGVAAPESSAPDATVLLPEGASKPPAPSGLAEFLARAQTLPNKPPDIRHNEVMPEQTVASASQMVSFGGPSITKAELNALRFGVKNENGDTAYFLPNFIEDPWEGIKTTK